MVHILRRQAGPDVQMGTNGSGSGSRVEALIALLPGGRASVFTLQYNPAEAGAGMERVLPILRGSVRPHDRRGKRLRRETVSPLGSMMNQRSESGGDPAVLGYSRPVPPPWWVTVGLWGVPSRAAALMYLWGTAGVAAASVLAGFIHPVAWVGVLMLLASRWYWAAIRWKDRHAHWPR